MKIKSTYIAHACKTIAVVTALVVSSLPVSASAAVTAESSRPDPKVKQAQSIMRKLGIPGGAIDGVSGDQTKRGLCAFRYIAKMPVSRNRLDGSTLAALRDYNAKYSSLKAIPASRLAGSSTYVAVTKTCQVMFYVQSGHYIRAMPTTTGMKNVKGQKETETPSGTYKLGYTQKGWKCSTIYPESCDYHPGLGEFATTKKLSYGNMYNSRPVVGDVLVHGSTDIRTEPASHGCIRVSVPDADWLFHNVGNGPMPPIIIGGAYQY